VPDQVIWSWYTGHWRVDCYIGTGRRGLGGATAGAGPPRCTKCNSPPINSQCTNHHTAV